MATVLVGADAAIAMALGALGLAGAMSDAARRRRREFAIRTALGSPAWRIMRQVFGEGARLAGTGAGLGLLGSAIVSRWLTRWTPDAAAPALQGWLMAALLLLVSVGVACVVPARRAATVDPLAAMRDE
jgi:putative ABC transport system permease protein